MRKVIAVLPAYQAAKRLLPFLKTIPRGVFEAVLLVDDASTDATYRIARKQGGLRVYRNTKNLGYGGNMKVCLSRALLAGADVVVEFHPDGEYEPDGILPALLKVKDGAHLVLGNRFVSGRPKGMYIWKYVISRLLTAFDNSLMGTDISDLHQGFRVYTRDLLTTVRFRDNHNDFLFTFEIICQALLKHKRIAEVPVTARYIGSKRGVKFMHGFAYCIGSLQALILFLLAKYGIYRTRMFE